MAIDPYLIPGTKTLHNKLGITDPATLSNFERKFTSARDAAAIANPVPGNLDFDHLKDIHKNLFQDVYEWAGQVRTVNIAKGEAFAPMQNIDSFAKSTFDTLKADNYLQGLSKDEFLDRAAHHLGEINALHPFRDGNGRAQRAFMDQVAGRAGYTFDWSKTNQREMIDASIHSFNVDPSKMRALLEKTLIEPLKQKDRQQRLDDLAANDPQAHAVSSLAIVEHKPMADAPMFYDDSKFCSNERCVLHVSSQDPKISSVESPGAILSVHLLGYGENRTDHVLHDRTVYVLLTFLRSPS